MSKKRLFPIMAGFIAIAGVLAAITTAGVSRAAADTCVWTGGGANDNFSTAANWNGCDGAGIPEAGDTINLAYAALTNGQLLTNDINVPLAGVVIASSNTSSDPYKTIYVTALRIADNGTISGTGTSSNMSLAISTGAFH